MRTSATLMRPRRSLLLSRDYAGGRAIRNRVRSDELTRGQKRMMGMSIEDGLQSTDGNAAKGPLTVFFDGGCPICQVEIGQYQRLRPLSQIKWMDVSSDLCPVGGLDRAALLARFHVRLPDGRVVNSGRAFLKLWQALPGWRYLGALDAIPGVGWMADIAYAGFLRARPYLQRIAGWFGRGDAGRA
jgi:predicted DCC family thiol-disulfide oxidoreductase YuxK